LEPPKITFWDIVQTLGAFVAVPVALLYPVGFVALFVQFVNYYFMDLYTAWYAASLVNRMIATEQGVTIFALALVASVLLSAWIASILYVHPKSSTPPVHANTIRANVIAAFTLSGFIRKSRLYAKLIVGISPVLDFSHLRVKGVGYARHRSRPKEVSDAPPTHPDDTGFAPVRATVLQARL
jgi:hypothetical protein